MSTMPPERLQNSPLRSVLAQIRFSHEPRLYNEGPILAQIHDCMRDRFPRMSQESQVTIALGPGAAQQQASPAWRMANRDRTASVLLTSESVSLETTAYTAWDDFSAELRNVLACLSTAIDIPLRERVGLRYINEVRDDVHSALDWQARINPALLGIIPAPQVGPRLMHSLTEARFRSDGSVTALRYGAVHEAAVSGLNVPFFLLDIDCYDDQPVDFDLAATLALLSDFNLRVWSLFRWSLTDAYYARLRGPQ